jgi:hypothetical protein|tara:strand:+ start:182 stop:352 length:171 start_codon:yes stop_codon:yes gene_type:complete
MRIYEFKQSNTSPLKYNIQLTEAEMSKLKSENHTEVFDIIGELLNRLDKIEIREET